MTSVRAYTSMATVILQTNMYWRCKASSDINSCSQVSYTKPAVSTFNKRKGKANCVADRDTIAGRLWERTSILSLFLLLFLVILQIVRKFLAEVLKDTDQMAPLSVPFI